MKNTINTFLLIIITISLLACTYFLYDDYKNKQKINEAIIESNSHYPQYLNKELDELTQEEIDETIKEAEKAVKEAEKATK